MTRENEEQMQDDALFKALMKAIVMIVEDSESKEQAIKKLEKLMHTLDED